MVASIMFADNAVVQSARVRGTKNQDEGGWG